MDLGVGVCMCVCAPAWFKEQLRTNTHRGATLASNVKNNEMFGVGGVMKQSVILPVPFLLLPQRCKQVVSRIAVLISSSERP